MSTIQEGPSFGAAELTTTEITDKELIDNGVDDHRYALLNPGDFNDATINDDAAIIGPGFVRVQAEHTFKRQTIPALMAFVQDPFLDLEDGNGRTRAPSNQLPISFAVIEAFTAKPYIKWPDWADYDADPPTEKQSLFTDIAECFRFKEKPRSHDKSGRPTNQCEITNMEHQ